MIQKKSSIEMFYALVIFFKQRARLIVFFFSFFCKWFLQMVISWLQKQIMDHLLQWNHQNLHYNYHFDTLNNLTELRLPLLWANIKSYSSHFNQPYKVARDIVLCPAPEMEHLLNILLGNQEKKIKTVVSLSFWRKKCSSWQKGDTVVVFS